MGTFLHGQTDNIKQQQWQDEIRRDRQLEIRNIERRNELNRPDWEDRQQATYPFNIHLGAPFETIQEVLIKQFPINANPQAPGTGDIQEFASQAALAKLNTLTAEPSVSEYIIQHLTAEEIAYFNQYFDKIKREIKKNFHSSGLDRDAFVNLIVNEPWTKLSTMPPNPPELHFVPQNNETSDVMSLNSLNSIKSGESRISGLSGLPHSSIKSESLKASSTKSSHRTEKSVPKIEGYLPEATLGTTKGYRRIIIKWMK